MRSSALKALLCVALLAGPGLSAHADIVSLDFDGLPAMRNAPGAAVPEANRLSNQWGVPYGVRFGSEADYVAVVEHSSLPGCGIPGGCPTTSPPNIIGGVRADGTLSYAAPLWISFFDPLHPAVAAVTDFVSIRGDMVAQPGATATMEAFDIFGNLLATASAFDTDLGLTLSISASHIHAVLLTQNSGNGVVDGTIGFDDLQFNPVVAAPVPEPASAWLLGGGLMGLLVAVLRCGPGRPRRALRIVLPTLWLSTAAVAATPTLIDFEGLAGMPLTCCSAVPAASQLSTQYAGQGVVFSSGSPYVAVVDLGEGHATSGVNGIGGSTPSGMLTYSSANPIVFTFVDPSDPGRAGATDFVSVRGDWQGSGLPVTLNAYGAGGALLASVSAVDAGGTVLSIAAAGIHRAEFLGTFDGGGMALDDLMFNPVAAAVPESGTLALVSLGLGALLMRVRRRAE